MGKSLGKRRVSVAPAALASRSGAPTSSSRLLSPSVLLSPTASSPPPPVRIPECAPTAPSALFSHHAHGASDEYRRSSPLSTLVSLAFICLPMALSLSPAHPTSPASTHGHHRAMRVGNSSRSPHRDLLLSSSTVPFQSFSPVPRAPRPRSARSARTTPRQTRTSDAPFSPRALSALPGAHLREAAPTQPLTSVQFMATPPSPGATPRRGRNMSVMSTR
jgi:hypothetical protein